MKSERAGAWTALTIVILLAVGCRSEKPADEGRASWRRTELFFGLHRPGGPSITEAEWTAFLNETVVPRFPNGFAVVGGDGRYRNRDMSLEVEPARVLVILYPEAEAVDADSKIHAIAREYVRRFQQESVLRDDSHVAAEFIASTPAPASGPTKP